MWRLKARSLFTQRASSFVYSLPSVVHCRHQLKSVLQQINALQLLLELSRRTRRRVAGSVIGLKPRDSMTASHVNMPTLLLASRVPRISIRSCYITAVLHTTVKVREVCHSFPELRHLSTSRSKLKSCSDC